MIVVKSDNLESKSIFTLVRLGASLHRGIITNSFDLMSLLP